MENYRGFWVWGIGITAILGAFLIFVLAGWPGEANNCINPTNGNPDSCYCEEFDRAAILRNDGGVRQPVNTWFNLYSILTSFLVAYFVYRDRANGIVRNPITSGSWIPDLYIFAVLFLGLGSMWFHSDRRSHHLCSQRQIPAGQNEYTGTVVSGPRRHCYSYYFLGIGTNRGCPL